MQVEKSNGKGLVADWWVEFIVTHFISSLSIFGYMQLYYLVKSYDPELIRTHMYGPICVLIRLTFRLRIVKMAIIIFIDFL